MTKKQDIFGSFCGNLALILLIWAEIGSNLPDSILVIILTLIVSSTYRICINLIHRPT